MSTQHPKKRKSSATAPKPNKLFTTLQSLQQTDERAAKKRKQSLQQSIKSSHAANDESRIHSILLELRILIQRCTGCATGGNVNDANAHRVSEELDGLLDNLLVERRELMGSHLEDSDVDYSNLIQGMDESSSHDDSTDKKEDLSSVLQREYTSLQTLWKSTLNKHHSNLSLQSGLSTSKFQSKAVDISFWEQVQSTVEHDRFKKDRGGDTTEGSLTFDDSKLYQHMLKDFISGGTTTSTSGKSGVDPAQDAAERLRRAMRKKSGEGDLSVLFDPEGGKSSNGGGKKSTVDRKASKGRKIRYVVHPKMVNFMFPVAREEPVISDDTWFKSLFGGVGRR